MLIHNAEIHDGVGGDPVRGSVAVQDGRIASVGQITGRGVVEIDAGGCLLTPGFVDIHTHYDGQCTWEHTLAPTSLHGVTSVVMGNCGVGFAPCRPQQRGYLVEVMEGVEDIPQVVMAEGLPWNWETFPQYLDALAGRRLDIDVGAQLPHSALRVYVMGERASDRHATAADLAAMRALTHEAVDAGALGVSTSRIYAHRTRAGDPAPSLNSGAEELLQIAGGLRDANKGVFQLVPATDQDPRVEFALIRAIAAAAARPVSFTLAPVGERRDEWMQVPQLIDEACAAGLTIRSQVAPRPIGLLFGLDLSFNPFVFHPSFKPLADLALDARVAALRDPELRARLLREKPQHGNYVYLQFVQRAIEVYRLGSPPCYEPRPDMRLDRLAAAAGAGVADYVYDAYLEDEGRAIFYSPGNYDAGTMQNFRQLLDLPSSLLGLSDGGAHYGIICDSSFPTWFLMRWSRDAVGRDRIDLPAAIATLTSRNANAVGWQDRGRIAIGYLADLNVIDLPRLSIDAPTTRRDLPAGARRLHQQAHGYRYTIKAGQITYRDGVATGALPGRLVRGAQPAPA
jgi:N-acyl-D-aspartate/D-glutamate deacylase